MTNEKWLEIAKKKIETRTGKEITLDLNTHPGSIEVELAARPIAVHFGAAVLSATPVATELARLFLDYATVAITLDHPPSPLELRVYMSRN